MACAQPVAVAAAAAARAQPVAAAAATVARAQPVAGAAAAVAAAQRRRGAAGSRWPVAAVAALTAPAQAAPPYEARVAQYVDDVFVAVDLDHMDGAMKAVADFIVDLNALGLSVASGKCRALVRGRAMHLWPRRGVSVGGVQFTTIDLDEQATDIMGVPIGQVDDVTAKTAALLDEMQRNIKMYFEHWPKQLALAAVRLCELPRVAHMMRGRDFTAAQRALLAQFDDDLFKVMVDQLGLPDGAEGNKLLFRPFEEGGLGLRPLSQVLEPARGGGVASHAAAGAPGLAPAVRRAVAGAGAPGSTVAAGVAALAGGGYAVRADGAVYEIRSGKIVSAAKMQSTLQKTQDERGAHRVDHSRLTTAAQLHVNNLTASFTAFWSSTPNPKTLLTDARGVWERCADRHGGQFPP